jgi:hypothetical protein
MEPEGSLPCSQRPYPESDESNPHPSPYFPTIHFNVGWNNMRLTEAEEDLHSK